jgi:hypothetical protein
MEEEILMRLTDDRYNNERLCLEVAMRMIRLEARTCTIRTCTGLSDDRVRKLFKSYIASERTTTAVKRRRGKSPREINCVLQNAQTQLEASLLAGAFATMDLLKRDLLDAAQSPAARDTNVRLGAQLCTSYEVYAQFLSAQPLSFEHAWFLWHALTQGNDLYLRPCSHCSGLAVQDRFSLRMRACPWCGTKESSR